MRIALVHDWLVNKRGAEHILEALCEIFPEADIFTLLYDPDNTFKFFRNRNIKTSFVQNLPFAKNHFRVYLPFFPKAIESFDLAGYDFVISINHCIAKGVKLTKGVRHICYCLTPMRYIWVYQDEYFGWKRQFLLPLIDYLKKWDKLSAEGADHFIAVSNHIRRRIKRCYEKDSEVIFPPVDIGRFLNESPGKRGDFYLIVSELVPYKRIRLAVEAFNDLGLPLIIIGNGPCKKQLVMMAKKNIMFLDWQPVDKLKEYYKTAKALIYPQKEDFGLVAVEAQAAGCPVIAYGKGGALDSVIENKTGIFFSEKKKESLIEAVRKFNDIRFEHNDIIENARRFDRDIFKQKFKEFVQQKLK